MSKSLELEKAKMNEDKIITLMLNNNNEDKIMTLSEIKLIMFINNVI